MFVVDKNAEKKENDKIIKEIVKEYKKKKDEEKKIKKKENNEKVKKAGTKIGFGGFSSDTTDTFIKCFSPVAIIISAGVLAKASEFLLKEVAKISPITKGLYVPDAIANVILTKGFWSAVVSIAAICTIVFAVVMIVKSISNAISVNSHGKEINSKGKQKIKNKLIGKDIEKSIEVNERGTNEKYPIDSIYENSVKNNNIQNSNTQNNDIQKIKNRRKFDEITGHERDIYQNVNKDIDNFRQVRQANTNRKDRSIQTVYDENSRYHNYPRNNNHEHINSSNKRATNNIRLNDRPFLNKEQKNIYERRQKYQQYINDDARRNNKHGNNYTNNRNVRYNNKRYHATNNNSRSRDTL